MKAIDRIGVSSFASALLLMLSVSHAAPQPNATAPSATERDGQHDFDFHLGNWKTHIRSLQHPLTGSTTWVEYDGTLVARKVWDGRAQLEELKADGSGRHIEDLLLFLYNPHTHQWSLNAAAS